MKTNLGPAETPLSVFVSLGVPRLVVGAANDPPSPSHLQTKTESETDDDAMAAAAAAATAAPEVCGENGYADGLPLRFPPTQVGEWREAFIEVENPADVPIRVQLASALGEYAVWTERTERRQVSEAVVSEGVGVGASAALDTAPGSLAAAVGSSSGANTGASSGQQSGGARASDGGSTPAAAAVATEAAPGAFLVGGFAPELLPPGGRTILGPVRFAPSRDGMFSAHVYLLNNLTHVEPVALEGEAGSGLLVVRPLGGSGPQAAVEIGVGFPKGSVGGSRAEEREVTRFPVDFRSWARLPPTMEPVVKRWILSNEGTIPLTVHGVGIRRVGGGGAGWNWRWGGWWGRESRDHGGGSGVGGDNDERSAGRWLRWLFYGSARKDAYHSPRGRAGPAASGVTGPLSCADGGFRVVGQTCRGRWQPQTLQPGQELELVVDYSAANCDPVGRTLDVISSAGSASVRMVASAAGGPSAAAACRSAWWTASASKGKRKGKGVAAAAAVGVGGGEGGRADEADARGVSRDEGRLGRAWLLTKLALLLGALFAGCAVLGKGPELPPLAGWARRLHARAAGCFTASSHGCGGFAVSVEVHASAAVVASLSSDSYPSSFDYSSSSSYGVATKSKPVRTDLDTKMATTTKTPTLTPRAEDVDKEPAPSSSSPTRLLPKSDTPSKSGKGNKDLAKMRGPARAVRRGAARDTEAAPAGGEVAAVKATASTVDKTHTEVAAGGGNSTVLSASANTAIDGEVHERVSCAAAAAAAAASTVAAGLTPVSKDAARDGGAVELASGAAVVVLTSPGQASKPSRQPKATPPTVQQQRPPLTATPGRGLQQRRPPQAVGSSVPTGNGKPAHAPARNVTLRPAQSIGGAGVKQGSVGGAVAAGAGGRPHVEGNGFAGRSSAHDRKHVGRAMPGVGAGGGYLYHGGRGGEADNQRARVQEPRSQRPASPANGGRVSQQPSKPPVRPSAIDKSKYEGAPPSSSPYSSPSASSSSSTCSSLMESLNPPALASPAASMVQAPEKNHGGRQPYRQPHVARKVNQTPGRGGGFGGSGGGGAGAMVGGYGRREEFRSQGEGHVGSVSSANATATVAAVRPPPSPTASSIQGPSARVYQRQASYPPPSSPALQAAAWPSITSAATATPPAAAPGPAGAAAAVSTAAGRPFQRPSSTWVSEEGPRSPVSLPSPAAPLAIPSFASAHASLPLGPIGSNRLRARSNPNPAVGPVGGAHRAPPGLSPPNQLMINNFRPAFAAPSPPLAECDPRAEAEWSDNLDAFATASAVAAGVLSAEDMNDPTPFEDAGLAGGGVSAAERWERYSLDASGASARRQPGCFSPPGPSGDGDRRRTASDPRYGQGLAFCGGEFASRVGGGMFEDASGRHSSSQQQQLAGTIGGGSCGINGAGGRAAGGSRLGHYMSAAGVGNDRRIVQAEAQPAGTLSFGSPEAPLFFGGSSRSSLGSSPGGGVGGGGCGNLDDMFGFMND